jgi:hypothetical protein
VYRPSGPNDPNLIAAVIVEGERVAGGAKANGDRVSKGLRAHVITQESAHDLIEKMNADLLLPFPDLPADDQPADA